MIHQKKKVRYVSETLSSEARGAAFESPEAWGAAFVLAGDRADHVHFRVERRPRAVYDHRAPLDYHQLGHRVLAMVTPPPP